MDSKKWSVAALLLGLCWQPLMSMPAKAAVSANRLSNAAATTLSPAQLQADLQSLRAFIDETHPDINHSASPQLLEQTYADLAASLNKPLTASQFWLKVAKLNPLFNDGHWSVNLPETELDLPRFINKIGGGFPFEVHVKPDGELTVLALAGGAATPWQGAVIETINGVAAPLLTRQLLALRHGDNAINRANLLGPSFQLYYASLFGAPAEFTLQLKQQEQLTELKIAASAHAAVLGRDGSDFADFFSFQPIDAATAYLKLGTFSFPDEQQVATFTKNVFSQLQQSGVKNLIIDVRENRGGNDSVWLDHVLPYLATQPYRVGSHSRKKVIASRASVAEPVGEVIDGQVNRWYQPQLTNPLHFNGKVVLLTGRRTYSSAVQFANVMQDFGFATVAGEASYARARSSGGIQFFTLPHSKLLVIVPRFWLARPQGGFTEQLQTPDWLMPDDVTRPGALVQAVAKRLTSQSR